MLYFQLLMPNKSKMVIWIVCIRRKNKRAVKTAVSGKTNKQTKTEQTKKPRKTLGNDLPVSLISEEIYI